MNNWVNKLRSLTQKSTAALVTCAALGLYFTKLRLTTDVAGKISLTSLEVIVLFVVAVLTVSISTIPHNAEKGVRNRRSQLPALKCVRDDFGQEELNYPWIIERKNKLPANVDAFKKVWVMGRYKVGKTSLLQWLGVESANEVSYATSPVEVFHTPSSWANTLFVESEGMCQPIAVNQSEFHRKVVVSHAHMAADTIVFVMPVCGVEDITSFQCHLQAMQFRTNGLFVVHILLSIDTHQELTAYATAFSRQYTTTHIPNRGVLTIQHKVDQREVSVTHYFLGSKSRLYEWNTMCIDHLATQLRQVRPNGFPLINTLEESLRVVGSSVYADDVTCRVSEEIDDKGEESYSFVLSHSLSHSTEVEATDQTFVRECSLIF